MTKSLYLWTEKLIPQNGGIKNNIVENYFFNKNVDYSSFVTVTNEDKSVGYVLNSESLQQMRKIDLGIRIWQVENNQLPNNIARIKYSDGDEKIINIF